ncbi:MAG TPA: hypothetical protein DCZ40_00045 [Lachnospiraceae bacterium]|nr:hypothetical protein [Lachnospiraceae bacterium]
MSIGKGQESGGRMTTKRKIAAIAILMILCLAAGGGTLAWYLREDVKQAQTDGAEVMAPYNLYLMNPNGRDSLKFAVGNLHPGEVKHTVICVSNRVPEDYEGADNMSELVKDSEFNYELQLVHTENLAVDYAVYPLKQYEMPSQGVLPPGAILMEGDEPSYRQYYWMKEASQMRGTDNTEKMVKEVFGDEDTADVVNIGEYLFFGNEDMNLAYSNGTYEYDYYLIEVTWQDISDFDIYKKETDLVYVMVNAKQPRPTEK